jgi:hypothetical protein
MSQSSKRRPPEDLPVPALDRVDLDEDEGLAFAYGELDAHRAECARRSRCLASSSTWVFG